MNKAIIIGNLTRDPESGQTVGGIARTTFTIAVNRRYTNQQGVREVDFIPIVTWRQTAELCARYLSKGRKVAVEGSIQTRSYDAQDGTKRYVTEIVADNVEFLSPNQQGEQRPRSADVPLPPEPNFTPASNGGFTEVEDDELPF